MNKHCPNKYASVTESKTSQINGKEYVIKSAYRDFGDDIKSRIMRLAERKTLREMGIEVSISNSKC